MIIESTAFASIPGLLSATLAETADAAPSQLSLSFTAGSPVPEFMDQVSIIHRGRLLFHGKVTSSSFDNSAGNASHRITVSDFRWALDKQTLLAQLQEACTGNLDLINAAIHALQDWDSLAQSVRTSAAGWTCNPDGSPTPGDSLLALDVSLLSQQRDSLPPAWKRNSPLSGLQALRKMKESNPGTLFTVNYTTGKISPRHRADCPITNLDTTSSHITEISGISPNNADRVPGVLVIVNWDLAYNLADGTIRSGTNQTAGKAVRIYPPDLPVDTLGVRLFSQDLHFAVNTPTNDSSPFIQAAEEQADKILAKLLPWLDEVNNPAVTGSVTTLMSDWETSPVATRLNLTGPGSTPTLLTPVTSVEWDFLALTATLTLGNATGEPKLSQLPIVQQQFHPAPDDPDNPGSGGGSDDPDQPGEEDPDDPPPTDPDNPTPTPAPTCTCDLCTYYPPPHDQSQNRPGHITAIQHDPAADVDKPYIDNGIIHINLTNLLEVRYAP